MKKNICNHQNELNTKVDKKNKLIGNREKIGKYVNKKKVG